MRDSQERHPDMEMIGALMSMANFLENEIREGGEANNAAVNIPIHLFLHMATVILQWAPEHFSEVEMAEAIEFAARSDADRELAFARTEGGVH